MQGHQTVSKKTPFIGPHQDGYELLDVLDAIKEHVLRYNWSISDAELWQIDDVPYAIKTYEVHGAVVWMTGEELLTFARTVTVSNWGAFLAYDKEESPFAYTDIPYSEGRPPSIQHPQAIIEIQAVDGGYFELFSRREDVVGDFHKHFETIIIDSDNTG